MMYPIAYPMPNIFYGEVQFTNTPPSPYSAAPQAQSITKNLASHAAAAADANQDGKVTSQELADQQLRIFATFDYLMRGQVMPAPMQDMWLRSVSSYMMATDFMAYNFSNLQKEGAITPDSLTAAAAKDGNATWISTWELAS